MSLPIRCHVYNSSALPSWPGFDIQDHVNSCSIPSPAQGSGLRTLAPSS